MDDFLKFRKMITPTIIQILFWVGVAGTIIGALIIATIYMGLRVIGVPQEWQSVILGLVILAVVFIDQFRAKRATGS